MRLLGSFNQVSVVTPFSKQESDLVYEAIPPYTFCVDMALFSLGIFSLHFYWKRSF